jgi:Uma2 family endonuclease
MSEDEYFAMLAKSLHRYEYWDGCAIFMWGAQPDHVTVEGNIFGELFQQLRGSPCRPKGSNQAVKLAGSRGYVFPDVSVVCGVPEFIVKQGIGCLVNPVAIFEVLSPSTADRDDTDKLMAYTAIRTVREYVIVAADRTIVKLFFRRSPDELWSVRVLSLLTDRLALESCGCTLTLGEIYSGLELPPPNPEANTA